MPCSPVVGSVSQGPAREAPTCPVPTVLIKAQALVVFFTRGKHVEIGMFRLRQGDRDIGLPERMLSEDVLHSDVRTPPPPPPPPDQSRSNFQHLKVFLASFPHNL